MLIGKHKMAPVLSPKKSIEGAVGGVVGAALLGVIYAAATHGAMLEYAVICGVGAVSYTHLDVYKRQIFRQSFL